MLPVKEKEGWLKGGSCESRDLRPGTQVGVTGANSKAMSAEVRTAESEDRASSHRGLFPDLKI